MTASSPLPPRILVVDDNPLNRGALSDLLEAMGYQVDAAEDGDAALARVRSTLPDLILLDIMMPGMNGYEVCRRLKADPRSRNIPVVFVTALSDTEDKVAAIEAGGDDFLTKPFHRPMLLARIRSLLRLKRAGDELESSYRKLQALERLRDDLMKMIVHDLKSPLMGVLGTLEIITDGDLGPLSAEQQRLLADAHQRGDDMLHLIDDLLELTQLEESRLTLQLTELEAGALLREVAEEWRVRVEHGAAELALDKPPPLHFRADEHLIRRVFGNLLGNAVKHGGSNLRIQLSAAPEPQADGGGTGVRFTVADNGVGIPEAYHDMIFHKFGSVGRVRSELRSSGLGLTFCKLAVEAHGGRIWLQSGEGKGSAFHFVLPASCS